MGKREAKEQTAAEQNANNSDEPCCASPPTFDKDEAAGVVAGEASPLQSSGRFMDFMKETSKPGAVDARSKKLVAIALSVAQRCEPCLKIHMKSALKMGISKGEIDEVAWQAIGFAGSPAMMLYNTVCKELDT